MKNYEVVRRDGNLLVKYRLNVDDTKHLFCYELGGLYYHFTMFLGVLVDDNDKPINDKFVKGRKSGGKYFDKYYNSSLNLAYKRNN